MKNVDLNDLIGKPFDENGYGPDNYSCYGLAWEVFRRYGIDIPRTNIAVCACTETSQKEIQTHLFKYWEEIKKLETPCGLVIQSAPGHANHLGVYIGNNKFIHITINNNVYVDRLFNWKDRIIGYYRYVGNSNTDKKSI
ncbi:MAG: C40 family peptidase [bacterium]|nr:C40 family peptidase [bacterium]